VTRDQELAAIEEHVRDRGVVRVPEGVRSDASALVLRAYCKRGGKAKAAKHVPAKPEPEPAKAKIERAHSRQRLAITGAMVRAAIREHGGIKPAARALGCSALTIRRRRSEP
jgi:hypothetical protein